jgi:hypothetical protein
MANWVKLLGLSARASAGLARMWRHLIRAGAKFAPPFGRGALMANTAGSVPRGKPGKSNDPHPISANPFKFRFPETTQGEPASPPALMPFLSFAPPGWRSAAPDHP